MHNRIIKSGDKQEFQDWIKENNYSILSPRHRGYYGEMIFKKYCLSNGITCFKINKHYDVMEQIPQYFIKKIQQKELKKHAKIPLDFFCFGQNTAFFSILKMGTSNLNSDQKKLILSLAKNKVYLFRIYEDAEMLIKKLN